jgi:hypothetical protein
MCTPVLAAYRGTSLLVDRRRTARSAALLTLLGIACSGCVFFAPPRPLADSVQELVPHGDGDHFVFIWQRIADGKPIGNGIQVEHVTAVEGGDFEITLSENTTGVGRVRIRDVGKSIVLLSEDDLTRGVHLQYDPPLPYLEGPVVTGEQRAASEAKITALSDGAPLGALRVAQVIQVRPAGAVRSQLGTFDRAVAVGTARTLQGPGGDVEMRTATLIVPGLGEIGSKGSVAGGPILQRELACALIGGRPIGNCHRLNQALQELENAGPADVQ